MNAVDQDGTIARRHDDHYSYIVEGGHDYLESLVGARVRVGVNGRTSSVRAQLKFLEVAMTPEGLIATSLKLVHEVTIQFGSQATPLAATPR